MVRCVTRSGGRGAARIAVDLAVVLCVLAASACTVVRGGPPEPLDALTVGAVGPNDGVGSQDGVGAEAQSVMTPGMVLAATRALALERAEWQHDASGGWGTVRRTGPDDERACTPAELTVHDYRGARVERRTLCPLASFIDTL